MSDEVRGLVGRLLCYLADGRVVPVITHEYSFADAAEAFLSIEGGHTRGKLVLKIG